MSGHLPKSWATAPVADIATLTKGKKPASTGALDDSRTTPYVTIKVFETGNASDYCNPAGLPLCTEDDILVVWDGARCGLAGTGVAGAIGSTLVKVEVSEVPPRYLRYFLQCQFHTLNSNPRGVGIPHVDPNVFGSLLFPLPPVAEQRRIVEEIEKQFTRLDAAVEALRAAQAKLKRYRASVLNAAVTGRLVPTEADLARAEGRDYEHASILLERITRERAKQERTQPRRKPPTPALVDTSSLPELPEGWAWTSLGIPFSIYVGSTPPRSRPDYWAGDVPWVASGEVRFARIRETKEQVTRTAVTECNLRIHPAGTVLLGMIGEGKTRGQSAVLDIAAAHNQNAASLHVSETPIPSEFVFYYLMANYESTRTRGAGGNQPALNKQRVSDMPFALAPLGEMQSIVSELVRRLTACNAVETTIETNLQRAERLRQAILKRAFEGELVPQDPDDEPAAVLLERIKTDKAAAVQERRRGRRSVIGRRT